MVVFKSLSELALVELSTTKFKIEESDRVKLPNGEAYEHGSKAPVKKKK